MVRFLSLSVLLAFLFIGCSEQIASPVGSRSLNGPFVTLQPEHHVFPNYNESYTFTFEVTGESLNYQWQSGTDWYEMTDIPGATEATYSKVMTRDNIGQMFRCYVYNQYGSTTTIGSIVVDLNKLPPVITEVSQDVHAFVGEEVVVYIGGEGSETLNCIWRKNGIVIPDVTEMGIDIAEAQVSDAGTYTCELYNDFGDTVSGNIVVEIESVR